MRYANFGGASVPYAPAPPPAALRTPAGPPGGLLPVQKRSVVRLASSGKAHAVATGKCRCNACRLRTNAKSASNLTTKGYVSSSTSERACFVVIDDYVIAGN